MKNTIRVFRFSDFSVKTITFRIKAMKEKFEQSKKNLKLLLALGNLNKQFRYIINYVTYYYDVALHKTTPLQSARKVP